MRDPGYYVAVTVPTGLAAQFLDGPWGSVERAGRRAEEILADGREGTTCRIVRIDDDGQTLHELDEGGA